MSPSICSNFFTKRSLHVGQEFGVQVLRQVQVTKCQMHLPGRRFKAFRMRGYSRIFPTPITRPLYLSARRTVVLVLRRLLDDSVWSTPQCAPFKISQRPGTRHRMNACLQQWYRPHPPPLMHLGTHNILARYWTNINLNAPYATIS